MDMQSIKKDFPLLQRKINGKPIIYLDSTASSLKPNEVIEKEDEYYKEYSVNINRGIYILSEEATEKYEEGREIVAKFINAHPNEVIFVRNATEGLNLLAYSWGWANLEEGDEIVSTVMEHHANIVPWQEVSSKTGAILRYIDITEEGLLDPNSLVDAITHKTKILTLTQVSNVLGTINPIKEIIEKAKKRNKDIKVIIDAAQSVPHMRVDVKDLGCDFLVFSGHKMCGPTGIGVVWGKYALLESMPPYQLGGDMIKEVYLDRAVYKKPPHKFEAGTPHIAGVIGLGQAVRYLSSIGMDKVRQHEEALVTYALEKLEKINGLKIYGPKEVKSKGGVISFSMEKIHPHDIAQILNEENICIRSGHHCAMPLHTRLGISSTSRASFYIYNGKQDVDKLIEGLSNVQKVLKI